MEEERKSGVGEDADFDDEEEAPRLEGDGAEEGHFRHAGGSSNRRGLWLILATTSTLVGRSVLTTGFPYPICFIILIQVAAYLGVAATILLIKVKEIWRPRRGCTTKTEYSWFEYFVIASRFCTSVFISTAATMCGAEALMLYTNLPILSILPVFTYVMDGLVLRLAKALRLVQLDQNCSRGGLYRACFAFLCLLIAVYEDYRLNPRHLILAIIAYSLVSISKLVQRIGPQIDNGAVHTWECSLNIHLLAGVPPMIIAVVAAVKLEDIGTAFQIAWAWGGWGLVSGLAPGALLLVIFNSAMNMPYSFNPDDASSALEDNGPQARKAVASTLQVAFWTTCFGLFLGEKNLIDWVQVTSCTILYIAGAGPRHVGFYPPRFMNLVARLLRKPQQKILAEPWQLPFFLWITISIFVAMISSSLLYFNNGVAYSQDSTWTSIKSPSLDSGYIAPQPHLLDIVIAHSNGDSVQSIMDLISNFATLDSIQPNHPRVKIYTKDQNLNATDVANLTGAYTGPLSSTLLHNTGGVAATFLHHILYSWDFLPSQTLFLSTSSSVQISRAKARFSAYFIPTLPIQSTQAPEIVTSFLNLGESDICQCGSCSDSLGWRDTFHLIPSMWGAAIHAKSEPCRSVLLTHGNNFVASADRIRGLKRDVWQMMYDGLVNPDLRNAWAHDPGKVKLKDGGWKWTFGVEDTLENPYLGYTIERLWGVLLQCSTREIAWRCPNTLREWRRGGMKADCGCLH